ncbi:kinase-like protein [Teratosphaeria nubilosa]|uniref:Kinase-like protein n=1 Tax=Teratosphaeria nubilosa TaxID=161662 RepID=A0A6G1LKP8_9PEZI|nr:kinase-like protein [Teratosphaeria nubilosa]
MTVHSLQNQRCCWRVELEYPSAHIDIYSNSKSLTNNSFKLPSSDSSLYRDQGEPYESTAATPSIGDIRIQGWLLRGVVGTSPITVIHAATHVKSGEVVAVKRLRFGASSKTAEDEVKLSDAIASSIRGHRYSSFVMQKHSVLSNEHSYTSVYEVYLLWKPLARGDFTQFGILGKWHAQPETVKKAIFVQILLGLSALPDCGWIHRDLKPANLGIVDLGDRPLAIIMDEAQSIRQSAEGHRPRVAHCGTVGYLAPELENSSYSPRYGKEVDIWSVGAVAVFQFILGRIPWSCKHNMFVPKLEARDRSLEVFQDLKASLLRQPKDNLKWLVGSMLEENPRHRPTLSQILSHVLLHGVRDLFNLQLNADKHAGMKRPRTT